MTISDVISRVKIANKFISDDDFMSDRFIYNTLRTKASVLLRREINLRKLLTSDSVYSPYECVELILAPGAECDLNCDIRRTKKKLPKIEEGLYSYFIQGVFNTSNSEELFPTTIRDYINHTRLRIKTHRSFYTIRNGYLYVLNPDVEAVNMYAYFTEPINLDECKSMYEQEFKFPNYLLDSLFELTNQSLIAFHRTLPEPFSDNKDDQP
jgi:hypothetical protein